MSIQIVSPPSQAKLQQILTTKPPRVPTNVSFFVDDANEEDWLFPKDEFGYIHTAVLLGSFQDFFTIIKRAHSYIAPGGYMESFEMLPTVLADDDSMPEDWPLRQWARDQHEAQMLLGKPIRIGPKLKAWYEEAGFVDVQERIVKVPIGTWPKDLRLKQIGHLYEHNYRRGLGAWSTQVFRQAFSWNRSEIEVYLANVRRCLDDKHVHAYNKIYIIWGRKPFPGEVVASTMQPPVLQPQPQRRTAATVAASTLGSATSRPARARPSTAGATSSGV